MRKSEMTEQQIHERFALIKTLTSAGWDDPSVGNWFEKDLWAEPEATMEYVNKNMYLQVEYYAEQHSIHLHIDAFAESGILVKIVFNEKLPDLLDMIVSFQDQIELTNYQEYIRKIVENFPNTYALVGDEGDDTVKLDANKADLGLKNH